MGLCVYFACFSQIAYTQTGLVINEIMANPNNGQLPPYEYIELFNAGSDVVKLEEYRINIGTNTVALPTYRLAPQQYILLCSDLALSNFDVYGNVLALSRWHALNNSQGTISLLKDTHTQDSVAYSNTWYGNAAKRQGGWSLERINPRISCNIAANWSASINPKGGTPCKPNSILDLNRLPNLTVTASGWEGNRIFLSFNLPLVNFDFSTDDFELYPGATTPDHISYSSSGDSLYLYFLDNFELNTLYNLHIYPVQWCAQTLSIGATPLFQQGPTEANDIVINEILFNPRDGGVDFVELYNRRPYPINLQGWRLGSREISTKMLLVQPQQYLALSTDSSVLHRQYPTADTQYFHNVPSLPAYPNEQGNVLLFAGDILIDSLYYNASMHQSFLKNVKGISLERQSPDRPTNEKGNFNSAATWGGGATPGYKNSIQNEVFSKKNNFFLTSKTVSPDGDSYEDFLEIHYDLNEPDYIMNLTIYTDKGSLVNRLIRQQSVGSSGKITWDCRTEKGQLSRPGIYTYHIEVYRNNGHREAQKGAFVITYAGLGT